MTTQQPLTTPTLPDTFEARWDRWVEEGIRQDQIAHKRAIGTFIILASTIAIVAVWLLASTATLFAVQQPPSRTSDDDVTQAISRLEKHAQLFQFSLTSAPDVEWLAGERGPGGIDRFVTSFVDATRQLRQHHGRGLVVTSRVDEVLRRGASIDSFMEHHRSPNQVEQDWFTVRRDLETLARAYNVIWHRRVPYSSATTFASAAR